MYHKQKKVNKKFYYILIITILIIIGIFLFNNQNFTNTFFFKNTKNILEKSKNIVSKPFINISYKISNLGKYNAIINENKQLNKENQELKIKTEKILLLEKELTEMKKILNLNELYIDYELVTATVSSRNVDYWFNNITINKGEKDGIKVGDACITVNGLIGKIISTTKDSSVVKLITNKEKNSKISVIVESKTGYKQGSIIDYQNDYLVVEGINNYDGIDINNKVLTSGFGLFPSNIFIGYVKEIKEDDYGISKILYVETEQNINDLYYITVLKDKK